MTAPGSNVTVTTEVGYCPFCRRTRNLRRAERHLGGLVRTNIECESCHRVLSSTIGPPAPPVEEPAPATPATPEPTAPAAEPEAPAAPARKRPVRRAAAAAKRPATTRAKTSSRKKTGA
jgi:uncharacterized membrane protein